MRGFSTMILVAVLAIGASLPLTAALGPNRVDLTKKSDVGDKRVPKTMHEMEVKEGFTDQRFPVKEWHGQFSPLGQRRAAIDVREPREKNRIRPPVIEMEKKDRKLASMNGRKAFVRNFDRVRENQLVPKYSEARVFTVKEGTVPQPSKKQPRETSMRDINRFTFQRNHSDEAGVKVDRAGAEEKK